MQSPGLHPFSAKLLAARFWLDVISRVSVSFNVPGRLVLGNRRNDRQQDTFKSGFFLLAFASFPVPRQPVTAFTADAARSRACGLERTADPRVSPAVARSPGRLCPSCANAAHTRPVSGSRGEHLGASLPALLPGFGVSHEMQEGNCSGKQALLKSGAKRAFSSLCGAADWSPPAKSVTLQRAEVRLLLGNEH